MAFDTGDLTLTVGANLTCSTSFATGATVSAVRLNVDAASCTVGLSRRTGYFTFSRCTDKA